MIGKWEALVTLRSEYAAVRTQGTGIEARCKRAGSQQSLLLRQGAALKKGERLYPV